VTRDARQPPDVAEPKAPYSPVVVGGPFAYTAGQVAFGSDGTLVAGGVEEQTRQVLDNVERCLASAGCSMDDVVKVTAFLSDLEDFEAYNRVYERRFAAPYPARSTVGARLADGLLVEIEAVALLPQVR
jgi:reactive intermediate/imine deaminase